MRYSKYPLLLCSVICCLADPSLFATAYTVSSTADSGAGTLRQALIDANANSGPNSITFSVGGTITILSPLPPIRSNLTSMDLNGKVVTISSSTSSGLFAFPNTNFNLTDSIGTGSLTASTASVGGSGGSSGGGGALGAGGGIFVGSNANVTLTNTVFSSCKAQGGNGGSGSVSGGGGGGMSRGNGGSSLFSGGGTNSGGGGGFGASGGNSGSLNIAGAGGGGGLLFNGGNGGSNITGGGGGGGGGDTGAGNNGISTIGGAGGSGTTGNTGGNGGNATAGGGNAGLGLGGFGGGDGGGGGGGVGGGGTAGTGTTGGAGGFSGGGGGAAGPAPGATGGAGGFGGGGGGGSGSGVAGGGTGGAGGFGGGGGGSGSGTGGSAGFGGGAGSGSATGIGGGGAALGGAIFVANGATLQLSGVSGISSSTITAGTGTNNGSARGQDIFLMSSGTIQFNHTNTMTVTGAIESDNGAGGGSTSTGGIIMSGSGILDITGNTGATLPYTGSTAFNGGMTKVSSDSNLGKSTNPMSFNGGTLEFTAGFTTARTTTFNAGGGSVNTNAFNATLSGSVGGSGNLTKTGSGTLTLSGASNAFSGSVTINNGVFALNSGAPTSVNVNASGAAFDISGASSGITTGDLSGVSGSLLHLGARTLTFGTSTSTSFLGTIDGTGSLVKQGSGTFTLTGTNTFNGGVQFKAGTIAVGSNSALGTGTLTFNTNDGNILQAASTVSLTNLITLTKNGVIDTNGQTLTLGGVISGSGSGTGSSLTKTGAGTAILTASNTYTGSTELNQGILSVAGSSNLGGAATGVVFNGGTLAVTGTSTFTHPASLISSGTYDIASGTITTWQGAISGNGTLTKTGAGTLVLSTSNSYLGGTTLNQGTLSIQNDGSLGSGLFSFGTSGTTLVAGAGPLTVSNGIQITGNGNIDTNGQALTLTNTISDFTPSSSLTKIGAGTLTLTGSNTYSGGTFLSQGTLAIGNNSALGTGTLTFDTNNGNILQAASSVTLSNPISLTNSGAVDSNSQILTLSGVISGSGTSLTKVGSGTLLLSGSNNYTGGTFLSQGTLAVGNNSALGTGALIFDTNNGNILQSTSSITLANPISLANDGVIDTNNQILELTGIITGSGALTKIGAGKLRLMGNNTYTGTTTAAAGTLSINGSITSETNILPGAFLNGSGTINGNTIIGGTLGPGNSIGTIEIVGDITFQTGSTFQVELDPANADLLDVDASGNITIESGATIEIVPTPPTYNTNAVYNVAQAGEVGGAVIGTFDHVVNTLPLINAHVFYTNTPPTLLESAALAANTITIILNFMPFSSIVDKGNPGAIAASLDNFTPIPESDMDLVLEQLYFLQNENSLTSAFNQMQPSLLNNISLAQQNSSLDVVAAFNKYTTDLRETRSPCVKRVHVKWHVWGDASIDWARQRGNHQNVGFHANTQLGAGGIDYHVAREFYIGALGAYTHTMVNCHDHLAKGRVNTYYGGLYSNWLGRLFFANASLMANFSDYHSKRVVQFGTINRRPQGHHHGYGAIAHLDAGLSFPKNHRAQYYPYGSLDYIYQHEKGYTETGAQSLDNNIRSRNTDILRSELGVQGKYCASIGQDVLIPSAKLGWVYEARFQGKKINARLVDVPNQYTVVGLYPNRSMLAVGASLTGVLYKQTTHLSLTYEGLFGSGYRSNAGNVSLTVKF